MLRIIAKPPLRALIMLFLGAQVLGAQAGIPALSGLPVRSTALALPGPAAQSTPAQAGACETIPFGTAIDRKLSGGERRCYSFTLKAGQFVQAVVEQNGIDVVVAISRQDGQRLTSADRVNRMYGPESVSLISPGSGVYRLQIWSAWNPSISGRYRVTLKEPRAAISSDEKRIAAEKLISEAEPLRINDTADTLRQARTKYEIAGLFWNELGEPYEEALALYGAGLCYRSLGANQSAIAVYERALELMRIAKDSFGITIVQVGMGWSYYYLGALDRALENFEQALQARHRIGIIDPVGDGRLHYGIGYVRIGRKENRLALESFKESLRLRENAKDMREAALARIGLGKAYFRLERYDESRAMLEEALQTMRERKDIGGQIDALGHLGWVDIRQKEYATAKERFREMLKVSLASDNRYGEAGARLRLALLARRDGELQEALDLIKRGVEIFESFRTEDVGSLRRKNDKDTINRLGIDFFTQAQDSYEVYIDLLMSLESRYPGAGHAAEALYVSERARARNLLDLLASAGASDAELGAARPLRAVEIQRRLLDENTVLLEYALGTAGDAENDRSFLWLVTSTGVESYLLPKRADIEAAARRVYTLLTERNRASGPHRRELIAKSDAQFQVEARTLSEMLLSPVAAKLAGKRLLIAPQGALQFVPFAALPLPEIEGQGDVGPGRHRDGAAKRGGARARGARPTEQTRNPQSYTPLIAKHEVIVAPSASALAAIIRQKDLRKPAERSVIVFADPVFTASDERINPAARQTSAPPQEGKIRGDDSSPADAEGFPPLSRLSATAWEAQRIDSLTGGVNVLDNFDASREAAIDPAVGEYRFIHFATHAVINPENPDMSAIALSRFDERGQPLNGLLSTQDIHRLKLPAELVVLSACRTGMGKDAPGEGLLSLTRGFLAAGAARVMVTLWSIEDQATAEMMSRFYRRMLGAERMSPAAALRATQEEMWREGRWGAPYYWGGFVLQGDWR
jgi:CHAT domain-containing protein/Tfp pilus assembly protein PilF